MDWHDIEEDAALKARTVPVVYGPRGASIIVLVTLAASVILSVLFLGRTRFVLSFPLLLTVMASGGYLLLWPAVRLFRTRDRKEAAVLFNRASYYPLSLLVLVGVALLF